MNRKDQTCIVVGGGLAGLVALHIEGAFLFGLSAAEAILSWPGTWHGGRCEDDHPFTRRLYQSNDSAALLPCWASQGEHSVSGDRGHEQ